MAKSHVDIFEVLICTADSGMTDFDEDLVSFESWSLGLGREDFSCWRTFEVVDLESHVAWSDDGEYDWCVG